MFDEQLKYIDYPFLASFFATLGYSCVERKVPRISSLSLGLGIGIGAWSGTAIYRLIELYFQK